MSIRAELNNSNPNRSNPAQKACGLGSLLNALIAAMAPTETGVVPASNKGALANQPEFLLRVKATAETGTTHEKAILIGPITGAQALVPAPGQCVWDGAKTILFNVADAPTAVNVTYTQTTDPTVGIMGRDIGQNDV